MVSLPQTISIGLGASLSIIVDYRVLLLVMAVVVSGCATFLLSRPADLRQAVMQPASPASK